MRVIELSTLMEKRMTTQTTLNSIAIDVFGQYTQATKNLVGAYGSATQRAVSVAGNRFEQLLNARSLPLLSSDIKVGLIDGEQRLVNVVSAAVAKTTEQVSNGVDQFSSRVIDGMHEFGKQTAWAKDLMVVDAFRRINLPAAKASQQIAGRMVELSLAVSERIAGDAPVAAVAKPAAKVAKRARKARSR
jgi:hypothetical protein